MAKDIVQLLRYCQNDPMWADHAEVPKVICQRAADEIERLRSLLAEGANMLDREIDGGIALVSDYTGNDFVKRARATLGPYEAKDGA